MASHPTFADIDLSPMVQVARNVLLDVAARDHLNLRPNFLTRAARDRAVRGVRAVEAFLRRVLIVLALKFEHEITVDISPRPRPKKRPKPKSKSITAPDGLPSLRVFPSERPFPDVYMHQLQSRTDTQAKSQDRAPGPVSSRPILLRLERAHMILETLEARAHRLAFSLARRRHGALTPPLPDRVPPQLGTEFTSMYPALGHAVYVRSRHRPPPQRPRPPPIPRAVFI